MTNSRWLIDTEVLAETSRRKPAERILRYIETIQAHSAVSAITIEQLSYRVACCNKPQQRRWLERWLSGVCAELSVAPFDEKAAFLLGRERARGEGNIDLFSRDSVEIAAIAGAHDLVLVTQNPDRYPQLDGLKVEAIN